MGNWKERVNRQIKENKASEEVKRLEIQHGETEERLKREQDVARMQDLEQSENEQTAGKLLGRLRELGAEEKLKQIAQEVWECGSVETGWRSLYGQDIRAFIKLIFTYDEVILVRSHHEGGRFMGHESFSPQLGYSSTWSTLIGGKEIPEHWEIKQQGGNTSLDIEARLHKRDTQQNVFLTVHDTEQRGSYEQINLNRDRAEIDKFMDGKILESCVYRFRKNYLPLDMKNRAEHMINRSVPWHKRVFRKK